MKYDVYADMNTLSSQPEQFILKHSSVSMEFICACTGRLHEDFYESMDECGFNEFEANRARFALVIPHGTKIPDAAYMKNR